MQAQEIIEQARDNLGAKRIFGEPYEKNGVTIIPAARVMGGAGAGDGAPASGDPTKPSGSGGVFGMVGGPAGAYVIKGNDVSWMPAVDVNRLMFGFQVVLVVFFLAVRSVAKARIAHA